MLTDDLLCLCDLRAGTASGSKWGREDLFPANPDLANILGDMVLDFDNFHCNIFVGFQIAGFSRFPDFQNLVWAGLEPSGQKNVGVL